VAKIGSFILFMIIFFVIYKIISYDERPGRYQPSMLLASKELTESLTKILAVQRKKQSRRIVKSQLLTIEEYIDQLKFDKFYVQFVLTLSTDDEFKSKLMSYWALKRHHQDIIQKYSLEKYTYLLNRIEEDLEKSYQSVEKTLKEIDKMLVGPEYLEEIINLITLGYKIRFNENIIFEASKNAVVFFSKKEISGPSKIKKLLKLLFESHSDRQFVFDQIATIVKVMPNKQNQKFYLKEIIKNLPEYESEVVDKFNLD